MTQKTPSKDTKMKAVGEVIMRRLLFLLLILVLPVGALAGCTFGGASSGAPQAVQSYLQALTTKDAAKLANLSCKTWESQATLELDSFQAVATTMDSVSCKETGKDGSNTLVTCTGKIVASYNGENQNLELSGRIYQVTQEGGEWRVCGYR
jgi:outer membrane lipoprotein-sorting protein